MKLRETILIRLDKELKTTLQELADKDSRKLSDWIRVQLKSISITIKKRK